MNCYFFSHLSTVTFFPVTFFPSCPLLLSFLLLFFPVTFFPTWNCYFLSCYLFSCYFLSVHRINNREAGDFRCHHTHYNVIVMDLNYVIITHADVLAPNATRLLSHFEIINMLEVKLWTKSDQMMIMMTRYSEYDSTLGRATLVKHKNFLSSVKHTKIGQVLLFSIVICFMVLGINLPNFRTIPEILKELKR